MILVTGATGNLGKATINSLLNKGISANNIAALVRDESKSAEFKSKGIQVRIGDYQNFESLKRAFEDVDKLLLISSSAEIAQRFGQHKNVIDAARESGVNHLIYTSFDMKDLRRSIMAGDVQYHADTSDYLKQIALPYTLMDNTLYADLIPIISGNNILTEGISIPAGKGKTPFLPITEMAEAIAVVLTTTGHEAKEYVIAAETAVSFAEIADLISEITAITVAYNQTDIPSYIAQLVQQGVPDDDAAYLSRFAGAIAGGEFDTNRSDVRQLLGRSPVSLTDFLRGIYGK
ncbi:SDR family oxidoreductase [Pedobacter panaciterrae]|uniref:SDR family oxidoreductase n=1 Tax=Pedobacter panaciterrae TaxID=363849 RepID=UPI00155DCBAE|nr:SDR family oxidoreductase [Pedobacter panaciterrae]NQX56901.1 SDR family oxidoreductase [Pedobacter panaciterrae]